MYLRNAFDFPGESWSPLDSYAVERRAPGFDGGHPEAASPDILGPRVSGNLFADRCRQTVTRTNREIGMQAPHLGGSSARQISCD
jgi:hypothetical protein